MHRLSLWPRIRCTHRDNCSIENESKPLMLLRTICRHNHGMSTTAPFVFQPLSLRFWKLVAKVRNLVAKHRKNTLHHNYTYFRISSVEPQTRFEETNCSLAVVACKFHSKPFPVNPCPMHWTTTEVGNDRDKKCGYVRYAEPMLVSTGNAGRTSKLRVFLGFFFFSLCNKLGRAALCSQRNKTRLFR